MQKMRLLLWQLSLKSPKWNKLAIQKSFHSLHVIRRRDRLGLFIKVQGILWVITRLSIMRYLILMSLSSIDQSRTSLSTRFSRTHIRRCFFHEKKKSGICPILMPPMQSLRNRALNLRKRMKLFLFFKTSDRSLRRRSCKNFRIKLEVASSSRSKHFQHMLVSSQYTVILPMELWSSN